jgi:hypothetical protein
VGRLARRERYLTSVPRCAASAAGAGPSGKLRRVCGGFELDGGTGADALVELLERFELELGFNGKIRGHGELELELARAEEVVSFVVGFLERYVPSFSISTRTSP